MGNTTRVGLTVAVTGPTGEIGISAVTALEREPTVGRIIGMARRPFEPWWHGWAKTAYVQGDVGDRDAVDRLVADADVVVHLAFTTVGPRGPHGTSERVNLQGARNVFEATVAAQRPRRLVYMSSVAAYGYHCDSPELWTEDMPTGGSAEHDYSKQKSACEALLTKITADSSVDVFVLRPCIVAGPGATALAEAMPWNQLPALVRAMSKVVPVLRPVIVDPGFALQLVHHDDVASAIALASTTPARSGAYNIAGNGVVTVSDVAVALGGRPLRVPASAATAASKALTHLPVVSSVLEWLHLARPAVLVDTTRAQRELGWCPTHTTAEALQSLAAAV